MKRKFFNSTVTTLSLGKCWQVVLLAIFFAFLVPCQSEGKVNRVLDVTSIKGDANNDGIVNMSDVTLLINIILGKDVDDFSLESADVNKDGYVNMSDVASVISIILGKTIGDDGQDGDNDGPTVEDDDANPGLPILMPAR